MKKNFCALALAASCFTMTVFSQTAAPYKAAYSSSFKIGNANNSTMILNLWKDWDDNTFDKHASYFSDTIAMYFPDGSVSKGKAAGLDAAKKYRASMKNSTSIIFGWVSLTSTDVNEESVCVWGQEEDTYADGKVEKRDLHEVWWFNKQGKISRMRQWAAKFGE